VKNRLNFLGVTEGLRRSFRPSRPYVNGFGGLENECSRGDEPRCSLDLGEDMLRTRGREQTLKDFKAVEDLRLLHLSQKKRQWSKVPFQSIEHQNSRPRFACS
jgi:hypothetical protein